MSNQSYHHQPFVETKFDNHDSILLFEIINNFVDSPSLLSHMNVHVPEILPGITVYSIFTFRLEIGWIVRLCLVGICRIGDEFS